MRKIGNRLHAYMYRGGSWLDDVPDYLAVSARGGVVPTDQDFDLGIRLVRKV